MFDRFLSTLSVVSRIPLRARFTFDASRMDFYLPLTGICAALPGLLLCVIGSLFFNYPALITALVLLAQYLGFNLFHLDGLMDTADAFLGGADREKRLAILKDSRIGVYGFFAGFASLSFKALLLYTLLPFARNFPALVFAYPLWGRFSAALLPCMAPPLNSGGLGALAKDSRACRCFGGVIFALLLWTFLVWGLLNLAAFIGPLPFSPQFAGNAPLPAIIAAALCLFAVCPLTAYYYARLYRKSLGGYTGDALGAAVETAEILCLAAALLVLVSLYAPFPSGGGLPQR
jgi:adenosylcobinamide-GDP ribazoletransferase